MELKKSSEANLEDKRIVFRVLGLVIAAAVILMAFTYNQVVDETIAQAEDENKLADELVFEIPVTEEPPEEVQETEAPPPVIEEIEIVEDDEEVEELDFSSLDEEVEEVPDDTPLEIAEEPISDFAEIEPTFPGGEAAMTLWIQEHVVYPQLAIEMGEQGTVYVQFVVNTNGSIEQTKIARGISDALDEEAINVVKKMPAWTPGEQAGKKVRCRFTLPINFKLG